MIWFVDEKDWLGRQVKKKVYKKIKKNGKTIETLDPNFFGGGMYTFIFTCLPSQSFSSTNQIT